MKNHIRQLEFFFINKYITYGLHLGVSQTFWKPQIKPFLKGFRNSFCILNPELSVLYFRRSIKFLVKILLLKKKILFIGTPLGLEREFVSLCSRHNHYVLDKDINGFFTNYYNSLKSVNCNKLKFVDYPSLIFVFSISKNSLLVEEAVKLDIPLMACLSSDDTLPNIDYPLPANVKSIKGSFFIYNLLFHLLNFNKDNKKR